MITAVVTFKIAQGMTREQWFDIIEGAAARFQNIPGLIRKQFLFSDAGIGGGVYLWETRAQAEALYRGMWRDHIRRVALSEPEIVYYETQIVVDNVQEIIELAA